jgi:hypothetical protein
MAIEGNRDYALARVQARQGQLLQEDDWRQLEAHRPLVPYVDAARGSKLGRWVSAFDPRHGSHEIERSLRDQWRAYVADVASWHSRKWQHWLGWLEWLPTLSLLAELARPEPVPRWMRDDPTYGPIASKAPDERAAALKDTALAPLEPAIRRQATIANCWSEHWFALMPQTDEDTRALFDELVSLLQRHIESLASSSTHHDDIQNSNGNTNGKAGSGHNTQRSRDDLAHRLAVLFRASNGSVIATLCHLGGLALQLERLRGDLAVRAALDGRSGEGSP